MTDKQSRESKLGMVGMRGWTLTRVKEGGGQRWWFDQRFFPSKALPSKLKTKVKATEKKFPGTGPDFLRLLVSVWPEK